MICASWVLMKSAPNYDSSEDAATSFSMVHVMAMLPLSMIFYPLRGMLPRKKYPPDLLLPRYAVRYDALYCQCMAKFMDHMEYDLCLLGINEKRA